MAILYVLIISSISPIRNATERKKETIHKGRVKKERGGVDTFESLDIYEDFLLFFYPFFTEFSN